MPHRPSHRDGCPNHHAPLSTWNACLANNRRRCYLCLVPGLDGGRFCSPALLPGALSPHSYTATSRRQAHTSPRTLPHGIDAYHSRRAQYKFPLLGVLLVPLLPWHHVHLCRPRKTKQRMTSKCSSKEPRRGAGYRAVWHSTCKTRGRCMGLSTLGETKEPQALQQGASVRHPKLEVQALTSRIGAPAILCRSPMHARLRESAICIDPNKWERAAEFTYRLWQPTVSIRTPTKPTSPPATPPLPMPRPPNRFTTHPLTQLSREGGTCPPVRLQLDCWKRKKQQRTGQLTMKLGHEI